MAMLSYHPTLPVETGYEQWLFVKARGGVRTPTRENSLSHAEFPAQRRVSQVFFFIVLSPFQIIDYFRT
jgi:hypothetical protein